MHGFYLPLLGVVVVACGLLPHEASPLRVRYVRFEPAPQMEGAPSSLLNFGLSNEGGSDLKQIVVSVSVLAKNASSGDGERLAGPYTLVGKNVLRPGQTLDLELGLRNLSSDCRCVARVNVLSTDRADQNHGRAPSPKAPDPLPASRRL